MFAWNSRIGGRSFRGTLTPFIIAPNAVTCDGRGVAAAWFKRLAAAMALTRCFAEPRAYARQRITILRFRDTIIVTCDLAIFVAGA